VNRALFVSDIHIKSPNDERAELFGRFLNKAFELKPKHLFLVGDIFDLWIADRNYFVDTYATLIEKLVCLKTVGTEIHYFEGNHDLDLEVFWNKKLGFEVRNSATYYEIGGKVVRVEHGDQMDPEDKGYLFLRWLLRTPVVRAAGRHLPNGVVRRLGQRASETSRDYTSHVKVASIEQSIRNIRTHAINASDEKPFDIFVSGHIHVREDSEQIVGKKKFRCINLGTWLKEPLVLDIQSGDCRLISVEQFLNTDK
jgi:UDP-2,3-diacylglucosamine hydrolase